MFATRMIGDAKIGHHETARQFDDDLVHRVFGRSAG
jgi:hypothetical protein